MKNKVVVNEVRFGLSLSGLGLVQFFFFFFIIIIIFFFALKFMLLLPRSAQNLHTTTLERVTIVTKGQVSLLPQ